MGLDIIEQWFPVKDYENRYLVSNTGKVKSIIKNEILKPIPTKDGYLRVRLWDGERYISKMIHRLVAEVFIPLPNDEYLYEVDHKDNNVTNNFVTNLQWLTHKENLEKSFLAGHQIKPKKAVMQLNLQNEIISIYESVNEAQRQTKILHISECATGKRKTAGGYIWKYLENTIKEG